MCVAYLRREGKPGDRLRSRASYGRGFLRRKNPARPYHAGLRPALVAVPAMARFPRAKESRPAISRRGGRQGFPYACRGIDAARMGLRSGADGGKMNMY